MKLSRGVLPILAAFAAFLISPAHASGNDECKEANFCIQLTTEHKVEGKRFLFEVTNASDVSILECYIPAKMSRNEKIEIIVTDADNASTVHTSGAIENCESPIRLRQTPALNEMGVNQLYTFLFDLEDAKGAKASDTLRRATLELEDDAFAVQCDPRLENCKAINDITPSITFWDAYKNNQIGGEGDDHNAELVIS